MAAEEVDEPERAPAAREDGIAIVTVAYRSLQVLPRMVASLDEPVELGIVDNSADPALADWAAARGLKVIDPHENLGFGRACNVGAAATQAPLILFLNPDAQLRHGALNALRAAARRHRGASAFGACLEDGGGRRSYKRHTRFAPADVPAPSAVPPTDTEVPVLSGAALMVRREAFDRIGGFDPGIFLFYEDDDLSLRLRRSAGPLVFVPSARVLHVSGRSTPASPATIRLKGYHWQRSQMYVSRKWGLSWPRARALLSLLAATLAPKTWMSPEQRQLVAGRWEGWHADQRA